MSSSQSLAVSGARDAAPFGLVVIPFGLVLGVVSVEAGLDLAQIFGFSAMVIAGAATLAAYQLLLEDAPTLIVILTALAVNLRMGMYSASLAVHLGPAPFWQRALAAYGNFDVTYALAISKYEGQPEMPVADKMAYFLGGAAVLAPVWIIATLVGALLGAQVPEAWSLDFAFPILFIAVTAPMVRTIPHLAAALTSIIGALALAPLPYNSGLLVAAVIAMMVGAETERRMTGGAA